MEFFRKNFLFLLILIWLIDLIYCEEIADFEILSYKDKKTFEINETDPYIRLYMEVNDIKVKTIYLYVYITDPTKVDFSYQFVNEGSDLSNFRNLDSYIVINHGSEHTVYYKLDKPKGNGKLFFIKIKAKNYSKGQKITVESTETITDLYKILAIILSIVMIIASGIIALSLYCIYNTKRDKTITESNEDVIIEKVTAEDYSPIR